MTQITQTNPNEGLQILCFSLEENGDLYGINVFKVLKIIKYQDSITRISYENSSLIEGLISIQEVDIPLLDMKKWFHYNSNHPDRDLTPFATSPKESEIIVMLCEFVNQIIGIKIHQADRIINKKWGEIEQEYELHRNHKNGKFVSKTHYFDGRVIQIVDVEQMLEDIFPQTESEKQQEFSTFSLIQNKKAVLLADDSPTVLKAMKNIFNHLGLTYYTFSNGKTLLDFIDERTIPLEDIGMIITDLEMPEKSGFEVIQKIKDNPQTAHIPVIANSSMQGGSNEEKALSLKVDDFILKSNPPKEIESIIKYYLNNSGI